jgi:heme exporter protein D
MIDLGPHAAYIIASFAATGLILGWMIVGSILALSGARRRLARLEKGREA